MFESKIQLENKQLLLHVYKKVFALEDIAWVFSFWQNLSMRSVIIVHVYAQAKTQTVSLHINVTEDSKMEEEENI